MGITEQINALERVRRLLSNDDYQEELGKYFQQLHDNAHAQLCSPTTTGSQLEFARARYVAARDLLNYLRDRESALQKIIKSKQNE